MVTAMSSNGSSVSSTNNVAAESLSPAPYPTPVVDQSTEYYMSNGGEGVGNGKESCGEVVNCGSPTDTLSSVGSPTSSSSSCRMALSPPPSSDCVPGQSSVSGQKSSSRRVYHPLTLSSDHHHHNRMMISEPGTSRAEDDDGYCSRSSLDSPVQIAASSHNSVHPAESHSDSDSEMSVTVEACSAGVITERKPGSTIQRSSLSEATPSAKRLKSNDTNISFRSADVFSDDSGIERLSVDMNHIASNSSECNDKRIEENSLSNERIVSENKDNSHVILFTSSNEATTTAKNSEQESIDVDTNSRVEESSQVLENNLDDVTSSQGEYCETSIVDVNTECAEIEEHYIVCDSEADLQEILANGSYSVVQAQAGEGAGVDGVSDCSDGVTGSTIKPVNKSVLSSSSVTLSSSLLHGSVNSDGLTATTSFSQSTGKILPSKSFPTLVDSKGCITQSVLKNSTGSSQYGKGTSDTATSRSITVVILPQTKPSEASVSKPALKATDLSRLVKKPSVLEPVIVNAAVSKTFPAVSQAKSSLIRSSSTNQLHSVGQVEMNNERLVRKTNEPDWLARQALLRTTKLSGQPSSIKGSSSTEGVTTASAQIGRLGSLSLISESGNSTTTRNINVGKSNFGGSTMGKCVTYQVSAQEVAKLTAAGVSRLKGTLVMQGEGKIAQVQAQDQHQLQRRPKRTVFDPSVALHPLIDHDYCEFTAFSADIQSSIITTTESSARTERRYVKKSRSSGNLRQTKSANVMLPISSRSSTEVNDVVAAVTDKVRQAYYQTNERLTSNHSVMLSGATKLLNKTKVQPVEISVMSGNAVAPRKVLARDRTSESLRNKKRKYKKKHGAVRDYRVNGYPLGSSINRDTSINGTVLLPVKSKSKPVGSSKKSDEFMLENAADDASNYVKIPGHYQDEFVYYTSTKRLASAARSRKRERGALTRNCSDLALSSRLKDESSRSNSGSLGSDLQGSASVRQGSKNSVGGISLFDWYREMAQTDKSSRFGAVSDSMLGRATTPMDESEVADLVMDLMPKSGIYNPGVEYTASCAEPVSDVGGVDSGHAEIGIDEMLEEPQSSAIVESFLSVRNFVSGGGGQVEGGDEDVSHTDLNVMAEEVCQMLNSMNETDLKMLATQLNLPDQRSTPATSKSEEAQSAGSSFTSPMSSAALLDVDEINDGELLSANITNISGILSDLRMMPSTSGSSQGQGQPGRFSMSSIGSSENTSANLSELFDAEIYLHNSDSSLEDGSNSCEKVKFSTASAIASTGAVTNSSTKSFVTSPVMKSRVKRLSLPGEMSAGSGTMSPNKLPSSSSVPELITVNMFWNDLPGLVLNGSEHVRLVDIHKQIMPAKDTGILKKRCLMMGLQTSNCTELQRDFLIRYMNAAKSKSTVVIGKVDAERLIGFYVNPRVGKGELEGRDDVHLYNSEESVITNSSQNSYISKSSSVADTSISTRSRITSSLSPISTPMIQSSRMNSNLVSSASLTSSLRPSSADHVVGVVKSPDISDMSSEVKRSQRLRNKHVSYADMVHGVYEKPEAPVVSPVTIKGTEARDSAWEQSEQMFTGVSNQKSQRVIASENRMGSERSSAFTGIAGHQRPKNRNLFGRSFRGVSRFERFKKDKISSNQCWQEKAVVNDGSPYGVHPSLNGDAGPLTASMASGGGEPAKWRRIHRLVRPDIPAVVRPAKAKTVRKVVPVPVLQNQPSESVVQNIVMNGDEGKVLDDGSISTEVVVDSFDDVVNVSVITENVVENSMMIDGKSDVNDSFAEVKIIDQASGTAATEISNTDASVNGLVTKNSMSSSVVDHYPVENGELLFKDEPDSTGSNEHENSFSQVSSSQGTIQSVDNISVLIPPPVKDLAIRHSPRKTVQLVATPKQSISKPAAVEKEEKDIETVDSVRCEIESSEVKQEGRSESNDRKIVNRSGTSIIRVNKRNGSTSSKLGSESESECDERPVKRFRLRSSGNVNDEISERAEVEKIESDTQSAGRVTRGSSLRDSVSHPDVADIEFSCSSDRENKQVESIKTKRLSASESFSLEDGMKLYRDNSSREAMKESNKVHKNLKEKRDHLRVIANRPSGRSIGNGLVIRHSTRTSSVRDLRKVGLSPKRLTGKVVENDLRKMKRVEIALNDIRGRRDLRNSSPPEQNGRKSGQSDKREVRVTRTSDQSEIRVTRAGSSKAR